ncbi:MAG: DUF5020 family protein [Bacteroidales bacterium]|jgi:hypothetical protein|nr:DUF5020 family protein [Bacteroidales bacterium]MBR4228861.1 DUF5020 family protein [Bacteroidales bacterium]
MKKVLVAAAFAALFFAQGVKAQTNFQTFYDFGRKHFTTTLEGFHQDDWGNTFFFIDYDYNNRIDGTVVSPSGSYFEIARCLNFWQDSPVAPFSLQYEYNGGLGMGFGINSAFLFGVDYFLHSSDFNNTLNLKVLYKQFVKMDSKLPMQFTAVWGCQDLFGVPRLRFSGFVDVWWEGDKTVVLSEPQLWFGIGDHANIGGEVELSYNFGGLEFTTGKAFNVMPCLGWKWVF